MASKNQKNEQLMKHVQNKFYVCNTIFCVGIC
jgi:hypothetical protein